MQDFKAMKGLYNKVFVDLIAISITLTLPFINHVTIYQVNCSRIIFQRGVSREED
jgi:hypothetical protein